MISRTRWATLTASERGRSCSIFGLRDQQRDFAFHVPAGLELLQNFIRPAAQEFLVDLRDLASHHDVAVSAQNFDHIRQRLQQTVRRFVEHLGSRRRFHALQQLAALS